MKTIKMRQPFTRCAMFALLIAMGMVISCKKSPDTFMFAAEGPGTDFFVSGNMNSAAGLVPCGEKLGVLSKKTENGIPWTEVRWKDRDGWVRESALAVSEAQTNCVKESQAEGETEPRQMTPGPVIAAGTVEEAAKKYYDELNARLWAENKKQNPGMFSDDRIRDVLSRIAGKGIAVVSRSGDYTVVSRGIVNNLDDIGTTNSLWQKWQNGWREVIGGSEEGTTISVLHLNRDGLPDVIKAECPPPADCVVYVYIGKGDGTLVSAQRNMRLTNVPGEDFARCGSFTDTGMFDGKERRVVFDCEKNRFVVAK